MAKAPAFQFYPQDFLVGTANFRPEEKGAYISLLCYQWEQGGINSEDLEQLSGLPLEKLGRVIKKFALEGNVYKNERLENIRAQQKKFSENQRTKVKKRWTGNTEPIPESYQTNTTLGNTFLEEGSMKNEEENKNGVAIPEHIEAESDDDNFSIYEQWTEQIQNKQDQFFEALLMKHKLEFSAEAITDHLGLLAKYPNMRPNTQQRFRNSLITHMKKFEKSGPANGFQKQPEAPGKYVAPPIRKVDSEQSFADPELEDKAFRKMIAEDVVKIEANPEFIPHIASTKVDWLIKKKKLVIEKDLRDQYAKQAEALFIQSLSDSMELIPSRATMDYYKAHKTFQEHDQLKIKVIAKELAYLDYLKSLTQKVEA